MGLGFEYLDRALESEIRIWDWGLGLEIEIRIGEWNWILSLDIVKLDWGFELGIGIEVKALRLEVGDWDSYFFLLSMFYFLLLTF